MTSLLSFTGLATFFQELLAAHRLPLPGAAVPSDDDEDARISERELEYFYWGLFPVY